MTPDYRTRLNPVLRAIAQVPRAAWCSKPNTETNHEEIPMVDDVAETETPNPVHSEWLADVPTAEVDTEADFLPAPVVFMDDTRHEQAAVVKAIGARMRQARELCNMRMDVAAGRLGLKAARLGQIEAAIDRNSTPLWLIVRAARLYDVSFGFLFAATDDFEQENLHAEVQAWLIDTWQAHRVKQLQELNLLHRRIAAFAQIIPAVADESRRTAEAIHRFAELNPTFEDMRGSARLMSAAGNLSQHAQGAETALQRFRASLKAGSTDNEEGANRAA